MESGRAVRNTVWMLGIGLAACGTGADSPDQAPGPEQASSGTPVPVQTASPPAGNGWVEFEAPDLIPGGTLHFRHPAEVEMRRLDDRLTVRYVGPQSPPGSEITDGYFLSIHPVAPDSVASASQGADVLDEAVTTEWLGAEVTEFHRRSELGDQRIRHVLTPPGFRGIPAPLDIAIHISGTERSAYEAEVERILGTMRWRD